MKFVDWLIRLTVRHATGLAWRPKFALSIIPTWIMISLYFTVLVGLLLTGTIKHSIENWEFLSDGESNSSTLRNIVLVVAAVLALPLALWRSTVAERQVEMAQRNLLNERYQKGVEMLGSEVLTVRLGGIYALQRLAEEYPLHYHIQIIRLFCAFARLSNMEDSGLLANTKSKTENDIEVEEEIRPELRIDVQTIMEAIGDRSGIGIDVEEADDDFELDLSGANLSYMCLQNVRLTCPKLIGTNLTGADLSHVTGLTQKQLDEAYANLDNPPKLDDTFDFETGEPLVWLAKPLDEE